MSTTIEDRLQQQVDDYARALLTDPLDSPKFRANLGAASRIGRQSVARVGTLTASMSAQNFQGITGADTFTALKHLRRVFDELNPGKAGDLLAPRKLLGIIPYGLQLRAYLRKYSQASTEISVLLGQLREAQAAIGCDVRSLAGQQAQMWSAAGMLREAAVFAEKLNARLTPEVLRLREGDPARAEAIENEVLFHARQAHDDVTAQLAVALLAYQQAGVLKKTGKDLTHGIDRMTTTGMSALAVAQAIARGMGVRLRVTESLKPAGPSLDGVAAVTELKKAAAGISQAIEDLAKLRAGATS